MAVTKMQKLTLVTYLEHKEAVVKRLQGLQDVEVRDFNQLLEAREIPFVRVDGNSSDNEQHYAKSQHALTILNQYRLTLTLKDKWQAKRPTLSVEEIDHVLSDEKNQQLLDSIIAGNQQRHDDQSERQEIEQALDQLRPWQAVDHSLAEVNQVPGLTVRYGTVTNDEERANYRALLADEYYVEEVYATADEIGVIVAYPDSASELATFNMEQAGFETLVLDNAKTPSVEIDRLEAYRQQLLNHEKQVVKQLEQYSRQIKTVEAMNEAYYNRWQRSKLDQLIFHNDYLIVLSGWAVAEDIELIKSELSKVLPAERYAILFDEATQDEIKANDVPVKLNNNAVVAPFESITTMYGYPTYDGLDPTPFLTPFYLVFWGMMSGDLGYGACLFILTLIAKLGLDLSTSAKKMVDFGLLLSIATMIVGVIYGSAFGVTLPFQLIDPMNDAMALMAISIVIGGINLFIGLILKIYLAVKEKDFEAAYSDGLGWVLILSGLIVMGVGSMLSLPPIATKAASVVAIVGAIGMVAVPMIYQKRKGVAIVQGLFNLYGITGYLGDFISYARLMALGISGGSIALAFNMLVGQLPSVARWTIGIALIVILHGFNMFLTFLSAYVHGLRLIFVEFFGKFYDAGGKPFAPIAVLEKYVHLAREKS
ncbi:MAG: V-type ATP synthase subunit I [Aerococcus sp.]|nr:V-type ATP synthase subunit I [Aerococcus sp.]